MGTMRLSPPGIGSPIMKLFLLLFLLIIESSAACGGRRGKCGGGSRRRSDPPPPPPPYVVDQVVLIRGVQGHSEDQLSSFQSVAEAAYGLSLGLWYYHTADFNTGSSVTSTIGTTFITKGNLTTPGLKMTTTATFPSDRSGAWTAAQQLTAATFVSNMEVSKATLIAHHPLVASFYAVNVPNASDVWLLPPKLAHRIGNAQTNGGAKSLSSSRLSQECSG